MNLPASEAPSRSLFGEILDWMLAPLLLLWPVSIAVTYLVAKSIAGVPFDHALESRASVVARQIHETSGHVGITLPNSASDWLLDDPDDATLYQVRAPDGHVIAGNTQLPALPTSAKSTSTSTSTSTSFGTVDAPQPGIIRFRDDMLNGHEMRIAYLYALVPGSDDQLALVQIGETLNKRNALANDIIKGVILPQFVILPLVIMLVWFGLSRGLAPLHALQARIRARRPDDPSPLSTTQAPLEIAPLLSSFNDLLARLDDNTIVQKRFIAQAAHQMKTPLAGLRMQAELALRQAAPLPVDVKRSLEHISMSSRQAARLVTQLLSLARAEHRGQAQQDASVDLAEVAREVVHDWVLPAMEKGMDLGYEAPAPISTTQTTTTAPYNATAIRHGHAVMLREMLANVIDNAIRYTPSGGRITVRVLAAESHRAHVTIEVEDTGPGIPASERERVFERFYRILGRAGDGSGLGLAIVSEIVTAHGGSLQIDDHVYQETPRQAGTLFRIRLPVDHVVPLPS